MSFSKSRVEEIVLVILVASIGLCSTLPYMEFYYPPEQQERVDGTKIQMQNVVQALDAYRVQFGHFPEKLEALVKRGVMPSMPLDKWDRPFHYQLLSEKSYQLICFGSDGRPGGEGFDEDIVVP